MSLTARLFRPKPNDQRRGGRRCTPPMVSRRLVIALLALAATQAAAPAMAGGPAHTCMLSRHDHTLAVEKGPCLFSERQGNVNVRFGPWAFQFPETEQGITYQRTTSAEGIRFNREGHYTLQVIWRRSQDTLAKPRGWATDNFFLGRWQGQSTAGRAVLDVLSVEPDRVRWGNRANGICDSDYSVETLPWGRNGLYPDQLLPPAQPTDLVFGVSRLTLQPGPCRTGDAVIQLAMPLDGSNALEVVTYDAAGNLTGSYGVLTPLP